jgi:hypothetical protein
VKTGTYSSETGNYPVIDDSDISAEQTEQGVVVTMRRGDDPERSVYIERLPTGWRTNISKDNRDVDHAVIIHDDGNVSFDC